MAREKKRFAVCDWRTIFPLWQDCNNLAGLGINVAERRFEDFKGMQTENAYV
jgi:hypothetical protein